ncbi:Kinesin-4 [Orbilia brochopaga]|nr:Kinesin-4 [Drechslerella brochopaga]
MEGAHAFQVYLRLRPPHVPQSSPVHEDSFLTVLPPSPTASDEDIEHNVKTQVTIHPPSHHRSQKIETFSFTEVLDESYGQADVFAKTVAPILTGVLKDGRDGMLATLGVTGSGKTHTILGSRQQRGMAQMSLDVMFRSLGDKITLLSEAQITQCNDAEADILDCTTFMNKVTSVVESHHIPKPNSAPTKPSVASHAVQCTSSSNTKYAILMSIYEVYNDKIFDLLAPSNAARRKALLFKSTRSSGDRKVVTGLRKVMVKDLYEGLQVLSVGQYQRSHGETGSNDKSSRSHCFISLELKKLKRSRLDHGHSSIKEATFTIVDLAGSERARNAKTAGDRLAEGGHINKSLMFLGQCLELSTQSTTGSDGKHGVKIPYRQSKLTELLFTNSYNPATDPQIASIIVTADAAGDFNATSQMLKYSALAKSSVNPRPPMQVLNGSRTVSATSSISQLSQGSGISGSTAIAMVSDDGNSNNGRPESAMSQDAANMISALQTQLKQAEERWKEMERKLAEANQRCVQIERDVREEVTGDMELQMQLMQRKMLNKLEEGVEREEEHLDRKLDMLKRTLLESNDENDRARDVEIEQYVRELEAENYALRSEVQSLKRKRVNGDSPLKERSLNRLKF